MAQPQTHKDDTRKAADFHGAAIIDANGREIPITEEMVQEACDKLASTWQFPLTSRRLAV